MILRDSLLRDSTALRDDHSFPSSAIYTVRLLIHAPFLALHEDAHIHVLGEICAYHVCDTIVFSLRLIGQEREHDTLLGTADTFLDLGSRNRGYQQVSPIADWYSISWRDKLTHELACLNLRAYDSHVMWLDLRETCSRRHLENNISMWSPSLSKR